MRDGTISALSQYSDLHVSLIDHATRTDILLAIVHEISENVVHLVERHKESQPKMRSVLIADTSSETELPRLVDCGVSGVLLREHCSYEDVVDAIRLARRGQTQISSAAIEMLARNSEGSLSGDRPVSLTVREKAVLRLFADGGDTALVARQLSYSERTIKEVSRKINQKLGASNRTHAVAEGIRIGLL